MTRRLRSLALVLPLLTLACPSDDEGGDEVGDTGTGSEDGDTDTAGDTETGPAADPNLLEVPGGTFDMGCSEADGNCDPENQPVHSVTLSSYWIEATEVTVAAYTECVEAGGCTETTMGAPCSFGSPLANQHPINCVTWDQADAYCTWKGRRLPSEAEWEFAARSNSGRAYPWGSAEASCSFAHMFQMMSEQSTFGCDTNDTAPVGSYPDGVSPFGALDLAGNVEEWTADWFSNSYYAESPTADPLGPAEGMQRSVRGGDFYDASPFNLRTMERSRANPTIAAPERGFRCAADQNP
ncbi:formylglycine-generating enzyme family protein [Nannocystaceae bacterium ST9]